MSVSELFAPCSQAVPPLYERYRPASWTEVIGQDKVVGRLRSLAARSGLAGRAYWLSGKSGTGKTTIARLIAGEVADEFMTVEVDASALTISELRSLEASLQLSGWGERAGRAVIVNEAHGLRKDVIRQLLVTLERIPGHVCWIFTTTGEGQENLFDECLDASPLLSRCLDLPLSSRGVNPLFAARAQEVAQREGLDGKPLSAYLRLVEDHKGNFRAVLQAIESGAMQEG